MWGILYHDKFACQLSRSNGCCCHPFHNLEADYSLDKRVDQNMGLYDFISYNYHI